MNMESKQVCFWELGCSMLHSWRFNLKLPWPLSPPNFSQISFSGITLCHVSPAGALGDSMSKIVVIIIIIVYFLCSSITSDAFLMRFGI